MSELEDSLAFTVGYTRSVYALALTIPHYLFLTGIFAAQDLDTNIDHRSLT